MIFFLSFLFVLWKPLIYDVFFNSGHGGDSSGNVTVGERLLSTLLTEMDGLEEATVTIISILSKSEYMNKSALVPLVKLF